MRDQLRLDLVAALFSVAAIALLDACRSSANDTASTANPRAHMQMVTAASRQHVLTLYGYNYTDRYMDDLSVNGESAGNVDPSTPDAGGGKGVCCIGWTDGTPLPQQMQVDWLVGVCRATVTNSLGHSRTGLTHRTENATAVLSGPVPKKPHYFEIHVYPDKHVELAITETWSKPRLMLDPDRDHNDYPDCAKP